MPFKKQDKRLEIDKKLIKKYDVNKSKFQRSRAKKKGVANFYYYRCSRVAVIIHTEGKIKSEILYDDKFEDIRKHNLIIKVSEDIQLQIALNKSKSSEERNS